MNDLLFMTMYVQSCEFDATFTFKHIFLVIYKVVLCTDVSYMFIVCVCILQAVDELLAYNADPCLPLTHGVGSALCVASSTEFEHRRTPDGRINLVL